jgi:glucose/mannose-6-phosphate isomerase
MVNMDSLSIYKKYDRSGMLTHLRNFPKQCGDAWGRMEACKLPAGYHKINKVVILGMGGSAIGGEPICSLLWQVCSPDWVC